MIELVWINWTCYESIVLRTFVTEMLVFDSLTARGVNVRIVHLPALKFTHDQQYSQRHAYQGIHWYHLLVIGLAHFFIVDVLRCDWNEMDQLTTNTSSLSSPLAWSMPRLIEMVIELCVYNPCSEIRQPFRDLTLQPI